MTTKIFNLYKVSGSQQSHVSIALLDLIGRSIRPAFYAGLAQLVEQLICNQQVGSSNLPSGS